MKSRQTLIFLGLALALGTFWYLYEVKGKESRDKAVSDSKLVFPELAQFQPAELVLRNGKNPELFLKRDEEFWQIFKPMVAAVDKTQIGIVLEQLKGLKNQGMVADKEAVLRDYGLDQPSGAVTFRPASGAAEVLFFGSDNPDQRYAYATIDGKPGVFMVDHFAKVQILKELKDLREKSLWSFDPADVLSVRSTFGKGFSFAQDKGGLWIFSQPFKKASDQGKVSAWLKEISGLQVAEFVDDKGLNPGKYGLPGNSRLELSLAKQKKPLVLLQGNKVKSSGSNGHYYQLQGSPNIFSMPDYNAKALDMLALSLTAQPLPATATAASAPKN
jgi:hypothetical protein